MPETTQVHEIWMPQDVKRALGCEEFPVNYYDGVSQQRVLDACLSCRKVGLSHIKLGRAKAMLICVTTDVEVIVFDMQRQSHEDLVKSILTFPDISFYTIKGPFLQYNLDVEFGINLTSALDLTAYDVFLSMRKASLNGALLGQYSMDRMAESRDDVKYRDRTDLAKYWLNVDLPPKDHVKEGAETQLIKAEPNGVLAANIIRKRSGLIRVLGLKMEEKFEKIVYQDTENLYDFAHRVKGTAYVEYENLRDNYYPTMINFLKQHGCDGS